MAFNDWPGFTLSFSSVRCSTRVLGINLDHSELALGVISLSCCQVASSGVHCTAAHSDKAPRPPVSESENPPNAHQQSACSIAPIQSTVPAVRPVPTLIGGATKPVDGLLGPAQIPSLASVGSSVIQTCSSPNALLVSRADSRKPTGDVTKQQANETEDSSLYSKVPIDPSVNLVLSRLQRTQNSCNALVATNQTELQSFTFTQNR
ncbi:uncharacterized protein DEA37_0010966 [Paragonimus westermani]|uniref:Uncharacterized protein n=1 Tax=Paragonimus westermani TaxID=34504 RepID=A0A5J4NT42_9TREM|nr:uncharacterized protein DEA37_0010966 [Paragonimus westermani]